jgi:putative hemolysin
MKNLIATATFIMSSFAIAGGSSTIGPANPAALNCIKLGGTLETITSPEGEGAFCVIEAWHLFNEMNERGLVKEHTYPPIGMPNPSAVNCNDIEGQYRIVSTPEGDSAVCAVEQWTLFRVINVLDEN